MRAATALFLLASSTTSALAFDVATLPDSCKAMIDASKADKPQFVGFSGTMVKAKKANDMASFCAAAKSTLGLIKSESDKADQCLGDLAVSKTATPDTVAQFTEIKTYFHKFIAAAKESSNDHMHCGLASE